ncbi:MAG TPA: response regulator transcription factor [Acidimicrobiales bacterium]|nr:response regulator transcription factor [Acidimicrobiales bacterium]
MTDADGEDPLPGTSPRILIVEDDLDIWRSLQILLERAGFAVVPAADGIEGLRRFHEERPGLVVLDVGLPGLDGWSVLERIRDVSDVPVMVLTARGLETDKARGLLSGADDYLTKPFSNAELVARVRALLRRSLPVSDGPSVYDDGILRLDFAAHTVTCRQQVVELTPTEFRLLAVLARQAGQVLSARQLLEQGWHDPSGIGTGRVKFTVLNVRRKLGWSDVSSSPIETVRGFGYRYRPPVAG